MEQYKNQVLILLTNIESRTSDKTADKIFFPMVIFSFHQGWKTQGCQFSSNLVKLVMLICSLCLRTIPVTIPSKSGKNSKLVSEVCWSYLKRLSRKIKGFVANVLSLFSSLFFTLMSSYWRQMIMYGSGKVNTATRVREQKCKFLSRHWGIQVQTIRKNTLFLF